MLSVILSPTLIELLDYPDEDNSDLSFSTSDSDLHSPELLFLIPAVESLYQRSFIIFDRRSVARTDLLTALALKMGGCHNFNILTISPVGIGNEKNPF